MADEILVTAADANRYFSKLLRDVRDGARVTITSHGRPVAEIGPPAAIPPSPDPAVLAAMEQRWAEAEAMVVGRWSTQGRR